MKQFFRHLFLPHKSNNQKAKLIHNHIIFLFSLLLLGSSFIFSTLKHTQTGVLGVSVDVSAQDLLLLTNEQRATVGLSPLQLNDQLSQAAAGKAQDMFAKDYWAHFAPDGKSPWDFIKGAGYNYVYAGENLARGYTTGGDVVNAWMNSPEHRENMLSPHYNDVGFAIERGRLPGDDDTVLVVEMLGSRTLGVATAQTPPVVATAQTPTSAPTLIPSITPVITPLVTPVPQPTQAAAKSLVAAVRQQPLLDSVFLTKGISLLLLGLFLFVFSFDIVLTEQKRIVRLAGHSFDHMLFLLGILLLAIFLSSGVIS